MSAATLCLPFYGYCIRGMNESAVAKWGPEGKRGTNGALMKISSLLINVEIYTHHALGQGGDTGLNAHTHTHTQKTDGFVTSPLYYALLLSPLSPFT